MFWLHSNSSIMTLLLLSGIFENRWSAIYMIPDQQKITFKNLPINLSQFIIMFQWCSHYRVYVHRQQNSVPLSLVVALVIRICDEYVFKWPTQAALLSAGVITFVMWSEKTCHMVQNWYFELLVSCESLNYSLSGNFYLDLFWYCYQ